MYCINKNNMLSQLRMSFEGNMTKNNLIKDLKKLTIERQTVTLYDMLCLANFINRSKQIDLLQLTDCGITDSHLDFLCKKLKVKHFEKFNICFLILLYDKTFKLILFHFRGKNCSR